MTKKSSELTFLTVFGQNIRFFGSTIRVFLVPSSAEYRAPPTVDNTLKSQQQLVIFEKKQRKTEKVLNLPGYRVGSTPFRWYAWEKLPAALYDEKKPIKLQQLKKKKKRREKHRTTTMRVPQTVHV